MADLIIREELAERLRDIARQENRAVEDVLRAMLEAYRVRSHVAGTPLDAFIGAFDDDVADLSSTVRETMDAYFRGKYGSSG